MSLHATTFSKAIAGAIAVLYLSLAACASAPQSAGRPEPVSLDVPIWPGAPDGEFAVAASESRRTDTEGWRPLTVITDVSNPSVTVIRPAGVSGRRPAMVILPGGAFGVLAWDAEGTEVGEFLAARGIAAFVLKYRVRTPTPDLLAIAAANGFEAALEPGRAAAAADAMQAVRFIREHAGAYGVDPDRVGMMGFSAGGITTYRVLQDAPAEARPNIAAVIYGPYWDRNIQPQRTPLFLAVAQDDPTVEDARKAHDAWQAARGSSELHIFPTGGHGFGLGKTGTDSIALPGLLEDWLREQRFISHR